MADKIPLKLVDAGSGAGELREFAATDTIPNSYLKVQAALNDATSGLLLLVGAFGIGGNSLSIPSGDCDLIEVGGLYSIETTINGPAGAVSGSQLLHMSYSSGASATETQLVIARSSNVQRMWFRSKNIGVWQSWVEVWHSANLVKTTSATDTTAGSMLKVGDFGLGGVTGVDTADCNLAVRSAFCRMVSSTVNAFPGKGSGDSMLVVAYSETQVAQTGYSQTGRVWTRFNDNGTWSTWKEMWREEGTNTIKVDTGSIGYGTGSGGTVTQATSKLTAVTLNKPSGKITLNASALAAGASAGFLVNNSMVAATDVLMLSSAQTASANYRIETYRTQAGSFSIRITNITAGSLSESFDINFVILKGAIA